MPVDCVLSAETSPQMSWLREAAQPEPILSN